MFNDPVWSLIRQAFALSVFAEQEHPGDLWQTPTDRRGGEPKSPLFGNPRVYQRRG